MKAGLIYIYMYLIIILHAEQLKTLFVIHFSDDPVLKATEEQAYMHYVDFLDACEGTSAIMAVYYYTYAY